MRDLEDFTRTNCCGNWTLSFGTLHTGKCTSTINGIIDVFPTRTTSSNTAQTTSLKMVVTQRLLKTKDGQGRCGAFEVMKCTPPIQNLIKNLKFIKSQALCKLLLKMV